MRLIQTYAEIGLKNVNHQQQAPPEIDTGPPVGNEFPNGYENQQPPPDITVGCKCGWQGKQSELMDGPKGQREKYCPKCGRHFTKVP